MQEQLNWVAPAQDLSWGHRQALSADCGQLQAQLGLQHLQVADMIRVPHHINLYEVVLNVTAC
jgi:hypothetical protein